MATPAGFTQRSSFFRCPSFSLPSCNLGQAVHPQISVLCSWSLAGQWLGLLGLLGTRRTMMAKGRGGLRCLSGTVLHPKHQHPSARRGQTHSSCSWPWNRECWAAPLLASLANSLPLATHGLLSVQCQFGNVRPPEPEADFSHHPSQPAGAGVILEDMSRHLPTCRVLCWGEGLRVQMW